MKHYLGLDAGGTKTFCLIGDERGRILGFGRGGAGNYECYGVEPAAVENRRAVESALAAAGLQMDAVDGIGMGIAGADLPEDYVMLEREIFTPLFGDKRRVFRNDSMGGLRGGVRKPYGIVIACGTGCVCAGVSKSGQEARVGGLGEEFGDLVSGSSIGLRGIQAVWQARDGILGKTLLTDKFVRKAGCADVDEFFYKMYRREIPVDALQPMAKLVCDAAAEGDEIACDILEWAGRYLGEMVAGVGRKLRMEDETFDVVMAGSVFKSRSPVLADAMLTRVHRNFPGARAVMPAFEPVVGALLLGMELDMEVSEEVYQTLAAELADAERKYGVKFKAD